jgi:hypothetical protein
METFTISLSFWSKVYRKCRGGEGNKGRSFLIVRLVLSLTIVFTFYLFELRGYQRLDESIQFCVRQDISSLYRLRASD